MKNILFFLLFLPSVCFSQTIYLGFQPADLGIVIRGDIDKFYGSISYGNWGIYKYYGLKNHFKLTAGIMIPLKPDKYGFEVKPTIGINYHLLNGPMSGIMDNIPRRYFDDRWPNSKIFNHWSFELGTTIYMKRFALGMRTDILRWEPCIDVGIRFK